MFGISLLAFQTLGSTQDFPTKPVRILVGTVPGGAPDVIARTLGEKLSQQLGQQFIIESRPTAGGTLVASQLATMPADGYTLLLADVGQLVMAPHMMNMAYDPTKDLAPVAMVATTPVFIVSNAASNIKSIADLIRAAKANPGKLNYGSSGIGSIHQVAMEMFKTGMGLDIVHVPFKGSGQSVPALLAGDVPIIVASLANIASFVPSGKVNLLAVSSARRNPEAPDVPSLSEFVPGYDFASEFGIVAPAGTPQSVLAKLAVAIQNSLDRPETRARLRALGSIPAFRSAAEYAEVIQKNSRSYAEVVKKSGIKDK